MKSSLRSTAYTPLFYLYHRTDPRTPSNCVRWKRLKHRLVAESGRSPRLVYCRKDQKSNAREEVLLISLQAWQHEYIKQYFLASHVILIYRKKAWHEWREDSQSSRKEGSQVRKSVRAYLLEWWYQRSIHDALSFCALSSIFPVQNSK